MGNSRASISGTGREERLSRFFVIVCIIYSMGERIDLRHEMRAVIIVKSRGETGKSSTLRELIKLLLSLSDSTVIEYDCPLGVPEFWYTEYDGFVVIDVNKRKIGCITEGDPGCEQRTLSYRNRCVALGCDIVVAASRTKYKKGSVYKETYNFSKDQNACLIETSPFVEPRMNDWGARYPFSLFDKSCAIGLLDVIMKL